MKLLLDTHIALWAFAAPEKLPEEIVTALKSAENTVYYSMASVWEIAFKYAKAYLNLRHDFGEVPPRVEYILTELGESFLSVLDHMKAWGDENLPTIVYVHKKS